MNKYFVGSLCLKGFSGGVLGGGLLAGNEGLTFWTGKVTVASNLRRFEMAYKEMTSVTRSWHWFLPTMTVEMANGESWKFFVMGRGKLMALLQEQMGHA